MPLPYLHYDVFTDTPLAGNQLAVFPDGRGLSAERMQAIAREMNFSETTFVLPAEAAGTDVRLRIFTPGVELPMAGHPTVGSTFALAHTGAIPSGRAAFVFGLGVGPTPVALEWDAGRLRFVWMRQAAPVFGAPVTDRAAVAAALGLAPADLHPDLPPQPVSCGVGYLLVALREPDLVDRARLDTSALARLGAAGEDLPVFFFGVTPGGAYSRMFAPQFGVTEDPATGSACGPLGCYLVQHGVRTGAAAADIVNEQGVKMQRPSRIHVAVAGGPGAITGVRVGGTAVLAGTGELAIDA